MRKRNLFLLTFIFITVMILTSCTKTNEETPKPVITVLPDEKPNVIDISDKTGFDFKIYYDGEDEFANFTNLYFEYDNKKTEVIESIKLSENGIPVVIKEDIDFDGKYELIIYLQEKTEMYYKEKICFLDYDSKKELSLEQINQRLSEDGKLEIKTCLGKNAFENEDIVLSYLKRKKEVPKVNIEDNRAFRLVEDISKKDSNITVEIYEDIIVKKINYTDNLSLTVCEAKKEFVKNNTELIKITKNNKGMFINTKGSYILDYKDVNEDNVEDIILINGLNGKISKDNVYYLNGANLEKQDVYVCETMHKTPDEYPLQLIQLNPEIIGADAKRIYSALRNNEVFYLNTHMLSGPAVVCVVKDFNADGYNEILLRPDPITTYGETRQIGLYNEKDFKEIPFSSESVFDVIADTIEYNAEYSEKEQACFVTVKDKNNNGQIVIKISSDKVKPDFNIFYGEWLTCDIVNNGITEEPWLCLSEKEPTEKGMSLTILSVKVIYEMKNGEFTVKDIEYTVSDGYLNFPYFSDKYKFEIVENTIRYSKP
ncbi:MAG TPA: hypothetical protein PLZ06_04005 [Clostridia bacterium]|nr:hypothetical protein [Clostridia bacterium]